MGTQSAIGVPPPFNTQALSNSTYAIRGESGGTHRCSSGTERACNLILSHNYISSKHSRVVADWKCPTFQRVYRG